MSHDEAAQARARVVYSHDQHNQDKHDRGCLLILKSPKAGIHQVADSACADQSQDGGGPDIGLQSVKSERDQIGQYLRQHGEGKDLSVTGAGGAQRLYYPFVDVLYRFREEFSEHCSCMDEKGQRPGKGAEANRGNKEKPQGKVGDRAQKIQNNADGVINGGVGRGVARGPKTKRKGNEKSRKSSGQRHLDLLDTPLKKRLRKSFVP